MARTSAAFTLIELLVVITIIVVLLALLTPALDKAIYMAELAACGANQRAVGSAALMYTGANKRRYPHRPLLAETSKGEPPVLRITVGDDRLMLQDYMGLKNYNDPLAGELDFDATSTADSEVFASFDLWFGFQYTVPSPQRGMFKLGDRFGFAYDHDADGTVESYRFDLLAGDSDMVNPDGGCEINHPDHDGILTQMVLQDQTQTNVPAGLPIAVKTTARWVNWESAYRGVIDQNFTHADGSVQRIMEVQGGEGATVGYLNDPRTVPVPRWNGSSDHWDHIPSAR